MSLKNNKRREKDNNDLAIVNCKCLFNYYYYR